MMVSGKMTLQHWRMTSTSPLEQRLGKLSGRAWKVLAPRTMTTRGALGAVGQGRARPTRLTPSGRETILPSWETLPATGGSLHGPERAGRLRPQHQTRTGRGRRSSSGPVPSSRSRSRSPRTSRAWSPPTVPEAAAPYCSSAAAGLGASRMRSRSRSEVYRARRRAGSAQRRSAASPLRGRAPTSPCASSGARALRSSRVTPRPRQLTWRASLSSPMTRTPSRGS
mmetsp:Transcript_7260/g.17437  ORF Transcript_7260/g.17437 Transcript_7260/m.17437 type:complete len:225 (+) Transcript_7260:505-1179(+)